LIEIFSSSQQISQNLFLKTLAEVEDTVFAGPNSHSNLIS